MSKKGLNAAIWVWIAVVLLIGGIGSGSATAMRVANGLGALGFGLLCWRSLNRGQTVRLAIFALLALLMVLLTVMVRWSAPVYELAAELIDAL
jgi:hypothetical protein